MPDLPMLPAPGTQAAKRRRQALARRPPPQIAQRVEKAPAAKRLEHITAAVSQCSSHQASSRGVENVLIAATMAPIFAAARVQMIHSGRFVTNNATRSSW